MWRRTSSRSRDDVVAGDTRAAGGRLRQRAEHVDRRRLAGAVGAEEAEDLAGGDVEIETPRTASIVAEGLAQVVDLIADFDSVTVKTYSRLR